MYLKYEMLEEKLASRMDAMFSVKNALIEVNPGKVLVPPRYRDLGQRILDMEVRPDDVWARHMDTHTYQTRNATDFALPIHHSSRFQSKPSYAGAKFFNILTDTIKRADPIILKKKLQAWLLQRPFYTMSEFLDWPNFTM
ncbi:hypothetical protein J6590_022232 [Homalodisca vitripennis]|nr:hypothetical protein J6590_022232 [Homalodisca vitripennis]